MYRLIKGYKVVKAKSEKKNNIINETNINKI